MAPRDPTGDVEPDFEGMEWSTTKDAIILSGKTPEEAVEMLRTGWRSTHQRNLDAWNKHIQQLQGQGDGNAQAQQEQVPRIATPPDNRDRPAWRNRLTPKFLDILPAKRILTKLEKKEFVEIWHFTAQGCKEGAAVELSMLDDTYSLVDTGSGLAFQSADTTVVSTKVILDRDLDHGPWTEGRDRLVTCMEKCGWSKDEVEEL